MYQLSRSLYRELAPMLDETQSRPVDETRAYLLRVAERWTERVVLAPDTCARPARTLFRDIRYLFPIEAQAEVWFIIQAHAEAGKRLAARLEGSLRRECPAFTRSGTSCQREPRPGNRYCPSHRHLEEDSLPPGLPAVVPSGAVAGSVKSEGIAYEGVPA